jgi:hypothetical protein
VPSVPRSHSMRRSTLASGSRFSTGHRASVSSMTVAASAGARGAHDGTYPDGLEVRAHRPVALPTPDVAPYELPAVLARGRHLPSALDFKAAFTIASARWTVTSCTRRLVHQAAGFGPVNVDTSVPGPLASTAASRIRGLATATGSRPGRQRAACRL